MSPLNNRVRVLRSRQSLSVAQLANRIGVSRLTLHALESGLYTPSLPLAVNFSCAPFNVPLIGSPPSVPLTREPWTSRFNVCLALLPHRSVARIH